MKKVRILVAAIALSASVIAGCGSSSNKNITTTREYTTEDGATVSEYSNGLKITTRTQSIEFK